MTTKILYVGNNYTETVLLRKVTRIAKYRCFYARNAHEGIAIALRTMPDLILINTNTFGVDGVDIMSYLKELPAFEATPMIAITEDVSSTTSLQYKQSGFTDVIQNNLEDFLLRYIQYRSEHPSATTLSKRDSNGTEKSNKHILFVTQNPALHTKLSRALTDDPQYITNLKHTGVDAIKSLQHIIPDIVVVDMGLPTAYGLMSYIRHHQRTRTIKIVALTDNYWTMYAPEARYADAIFIKPVVAKEFFTMVQHLLAEAPM